MPEAEVTVLDVRPGELLRLLFADDRIEAELSLEAAPGGHTKATLAIDAFFQPHVLVNDGDLIGEHFEQLPVAGGVRHFGFLLPQ